MDSKCLILLVACIGLINCYNYSLVTPTQDCNDNFIAQKLELITQFTPISDKNLIFRYELSYEIQHRNNNIFSSVFQKNNNKFIFINIKQTMYKRDAQQFGYLFDGKNEYFFSLDDFEMNKYYTDYKIDKIQIIHHENYEFTQVKSVDALIAQIWTQYSDAYDKPTKLCFIVNYGNNTYYYPQSKYQLQFIEFGFG